MRQCESGSPFRENDRLLHLLVLMQFPRESALRFSRENRYALFLELLWRRWQSSPCLRRRRPTPPIRTGRKSIVATRPM
ncbi:hypothetical protein EN808_23560 [Mesorhizobium sp. M8A.F.Ca.ET.165.01.1.1]|nr:hypothetical protein EN808_23560 [Mesorhizobium sp. M8A.F.Ca.ET.165.01.1.1]